MKTCIDCKSNKPTSDFYKRSKSKDGLQVRCKDCARTLRKKHYQSDAGKALKQKAQAAFYIRNRTWVKRYLEANPCIDCGEDDIVVLEFDHRDDVEKVNNVSYMVRYFSLDKIKLEVDKCDVRCCNCHRRRTAKQFNWWQ